MTGLQGIADTRPRRRWPVWLLLLTVACLAVVWFVRAALWPCGALDRTSGCVSSVPLDVTAAGIDAASAEVDWPAFDLGPGGKTALVGITGKMGEEQRSSLALYDAKSGALQQIFDENAKTGDTGFQISFSGAALSPDGQLAAAASRSVEGEMPVTELTVYNVSDGRVLKVLKRAEGENQELIDCVSMLDFSADGSQLQCGFQLFDIATGAPTSLVDNNMLIFPMPADFPGSGRAPDGTLAEPQDLKSPLRLFDADVGTYFAPDSIGLLEVWRAYRENRGQRFYTPSVFRQMSAVAIWNGKTKTLQRNFYSNQRYVRAAWSRDSAWFGFVTDELRLEVFKR